MDTETIDLTDPLMDLLKYQHLTEESLNERISVLAYKRSSDGDNNAESITMDDILDRPCTITPLARPISSFTPDETIVLSDEEEQDPAANSETTNEKTENVETVELSSDDSDQNEDDVFEEVSITRIPYTPPCQEIVFESKSRQPNKAMTLGMSTTSNNKSLVHNSFKAGISRATIGSVVSVGCNPQSLPQMKTSSLLKLQPKRNSIRLPSGRVAVLKRIVLDTKSNPLHQTNAVNVVIPVSQGVVTKPKISKARAASKPTSQSKGDAKCTLKTNDTGVLTVLPDLDIQNDDHFQVSSTKRVYSRSKKFSASSVRPRKSTVSDLHGVTTKSENLVLIDELKNNLENNDKDKSPKEHIDDVGPIPTESVSVERPINVDLVVQRESSSTETSVGFHLPVDEALLLSKLQPDQSQVISDQLNESSDLSGLAKSDSGNAGFSSCSTKDALSAPNTLEQKRVDESSTNRDIKLGIEKITATEPLTRSKASPSTVQSQVDLVDSVNNKNYSSEDPLQLTNGSEDEPLVPSSSEAENSNFGIKSSSTEVPLLSSKEIPDNIQPVASQVDLVENNKNYLFESPSSLVQNELVQNKGNDSVKVDMDISQNVSHSSGEPNEFSKVAVVTSPEVESNEMKNSSTEVLLTSDTIPTLSSQVNLGQDSKNPSSANLVASGPAHTENDVPAKPFPSDEDLARDNTKNFSALDKIQLVNDKDDNRTFDLQNVAIPDKTDSSLTTTLLKSNIIEDTSVKWKKSNEIDLNAKDNSNDKLPGSKSSSLSSEISSLSGLLAFCLEDSETFDNASTSMSERPEKINEDESVLETTKKSCMSNIEKKSLVKVDVIPKPEILAADNLETAGCERNPEKNSRISDELHNSLSESKSEIDRSVVSVQEGLSLERNNDVVVALGMKKNAEETDIKETNAKDTHNESKDDIWSANSNEEVGTDAPSTKELISNVDTKLKLAKKLKEFETSYKAIPVISAHSDEPDANVGTGECKEPELSNSEAASKPIRHHLEALESSSPAIPSTSSDGLQLSPTTIPLNSKSDPEDNERSHETEKPTINFEEIRNNLRLQLTCLRARKRTDIFQDVKQTLVAEKDLCKASTSFDYNKHGQGPCKDRENNETSNKQENALQSSERQIQAKERSEPKPFLKDIEETQVDDQKNTEPPKTYLTVKSFAQLTGASTSQSKELSQTPTNSGEPHDSEDLPSVFNEIRRIIRKQKTRPDPKTLPDVAAPRLSSHVVANESSSDSAEFVESQKLPSLSDQNGTKQKSESSPFVSNTLEEFLTDSQLNVSYAIPKSGAEVGLRSSYPVFPLPSKSDVKEESNEKSKSKSTYKPKTLAEKRKILEKNKKLEAKRLNKLREQQQLLKRSFVLFKDKKVFVHSKTRGRCIASVESSETGDLVSGDPSAQLRPSLLREYYKKGTTLKYKPGPLSKKHLLQSDYSHWTSELKDLPTPMVHVLPQLGKAVHPNLLPHIVSQWGSEVSEDQLNFALTAVVDKNPSIPETFQFPLEYQRGQNKLLVRKKAANAPVPTLYSAPSDEDISLNLKEDVNAVINGLLTYVETKVLEPSLIKDAEDVNPQDQPLQTEVALETDKQPRKKKSRTNRELLRLSCKVVTVDAKEVVPKNNCCKPHCRLGCVCKSLECSTVIGAHCRKIACMFDCSCPKERSAVISISHQRTAGNANTDYLSMDTVSRIEDQAKRNLAKVEKEFTQTVIYTNESAIIVGSGYKPRRATKTPKKYSDFIEDEVLSAVEEDPVKHIKPCYISMEKRDFSDILPYCLVHFLYNCHCKGYSSVPSSASRPLITEAPRDTYVSKIIRTETKASSSELISKSVEKRTWASRSFHKELVSPESKNQESNLKKVRFRKRKSTMMNDFVPHYKLRVTSSPAETTDGSSCSRTSKVDTKYCTVKSYSHGVTYNDWCNNISESDILQLKSFTEDQMTDCNRLKKDFFEDMRSKQTRTSSRTHPRKQQLRVRKDVENLNLEAVNKSKPSYTIVPVFPGEIIVNDSEVVRKLCNNSKQHKDSYARILPWAALLKGYLENTINITCIFEVPLKLILSVGSKLSGPKVLDVKTSGPVILDTSLQFISSPGLLKLSENVRDIIRWLMAGTCLPKYKPKALSFLLVEAVPGQFEIRGLCTQAEKPAQGQQATVAEKSPQIEKIVQAEIFKKQIITQFDTPKKSPQVEEPQKPPKPEESQKLPKPEKPTPIRKRRRKNERKPHEDLLSTSAAEPLAEKENDDNVIEIKHKNVKNKIVSLFVTKKEFPMRELIEDGKDDDLADNLYMWVALPEVYKVAKWRVVFLTGDFLYLHFKHIDYSIRYSDLAKLTEMANEAKQTLLVTNAKIMHNHNHLLYGIYVSQKYSDRIFIGPYFINYDFNDIDTIRCINNMLVSTESLNKMKGNTNYKCGNWMYERIYNYSPKKFLREPLIPATSSTATESRDIIEMPSTKDDVSASTNSSDNQIVHHSGFTVNIKSCVPRTPSEFNRYIITNIPHFGYLGAYQPENSTVLEVSWPFEKKVLQFDNADNARDFLQERFNQLLQPVPETFKIQVIVLVHLDLNEYKPINSDLLNGQSICGYFGAYNFKDLTDEFCKEKLNISKQEITFLFAKRAHDYIRNKLQDLAEITGICQGNSEEYNVSNILEKAKLEIKQQQQFRMQLVEEIEALETTVVSKIRQIFSEIKKLPPKYRNIESRILNETLRFRPKRLMPSEVIDITEEDNPAEAPLHTTSITGIQVDARSSSPKFSVQDGVKRKEPPISKSRAPKVAKIAPFSSKPVVTTTKEGENQSDKSDGVK